MKKVLLAAVVILAAFYSLDRQAPVVDVSAPAETRTTGSSERWHAGQQVQGSGTVSRILADDNGGSRHQRYILRLDSGKTLLVAHNIDLAPRVAGLRDGDTVIVNRTALVVASDSINAVGQPLTSVANVFALIKLLNNTN